jgi:hypothetical protein
MDLDTGAYGEWLACLERVLKQQDEQGRVYYVEGWEDRRVG